MRTWFTICWIAWGMCALCWAQTGDSLAEKAQEWKAEALQLRKARNYPEAAAQYAKAADLFQELENWGQYVSSLSLQGQTEVRAGQKQAGVDKMKQAVEIAHAQLSPTHQELAKAQTRLAIYYLSIRAYGTAKDLFAQSLEIKEAIPDSFSLTSRSASFVNLGTSYYRLGFLTKADSMLQRGIELLRAEGLPNHPNASAAHSMLGSLLLDKRDYEAAVDHLNKALDIKLSQARVDSFALIQTYTNLGLAHYYNQQWEEAKSYYERVLRMKRQRLGESHPQLAITYLNLGAFYQKRKQYPEALDCYQKVEQIHQKAGVINHPQLAKSSLNIGLIYTIQRQYDLSLQSLSQALNQLMRATPIQQVEVSKCLMTIGNVHKAKQEHEEAEYMYQRAISGLYPQDSADKFGEVYHLPMLLEVRGYQVENLLSHYHRSGESSLLEKAYSLQKEVIQLIDTIRFGFSTPGAREMLAGKTKFYYEDAIEVCWEMYQWKQDSIYVQEAFQYGEKSKGLLLREALSEAQALDFAGIPTEIVKELEWLKQEIGFLQKQIYDSKQRGGLSAQVASLQGDLFELKRSFANLTQDLEEQYPEYYRLKYDPFVLEVDVLQARLEENGDHMISYFLGRRFLYAFAVTPESFRFSQVSAQQIASVDIPSFCKELADADQASQSARSPHFFQQFNSRAFSLYQLLLAPLLTPQDSGNWLIVPDGVLGYLPFELLLTEAVDPTSKVDYGLLPYVLKRLLLRYEYSATLYLDAPTLATKGKPYAGFAPSYLPEDRPKSIAQQREGFDPLIFNQEEVKGISDLMGGRAFLAGEATEENFRLHGGSYQILHLAMHGYTNDEAPLYSGLAFGEKEDDMLYAYELYNLELKAALVVLSACNTGRGKLAKGEGILSLARAFKYAGCPNIVMSLWQVDDKATEEIMELFFANIQQGLAKDEALRQAKISYLDGTHRNHPFYWAPFVLIGDAAPVETHGFPWMWVLGLILLGGIGVRLIWQRKRALG